MSFPQDAKLAAPRMLLAITRPEEEKKLEAIFDAVHVPILYQCRGQGTAPLRSCWTFSGWGAPPGSSPLGCCPSLP